MTAEDKCTFNFSGGDGVAPVAITLARTDLNKKCFADSMLTTLAADRWQDASTTSNDSSFDVSTQSIHDSWSAPCASVIKHIYESPAPVVPEVQNESASKLEIPAGVELEEIVNVLDYFGLDLVEPEGMEITGNGASKVRAKLFLSNRENVETAFSYVFEQLLDSPRSKSQFVVLSSNDKLDYINKSQQEPLKLICKSGYLAMGERDKHYEWAQSEAHRNHFSDLLDEEGFEVEWKSKYLELAGGRDNEYGPMDIDTVRASRWVAAVTVPGAEPPSKRARVDSSLS